MSYPDIIVSGAGTSAFNGTYYDTGNLINGRPIYEDGANHQIKSLTGAWLIVQLSPPGNAYRSAINDAPDTPDLVAAWFVASVPGTAPAPTVTAASSGQNLTLTCAAGSYSLTGTNVTLTATVKQNLTLACSAGSYSLTGTNADLTVKRNYVLACEGGSYSLTGTNADLTPSRTLVCDSASGGAYPDIIVSGAGTSDANGTYSYVMEFSGRPLYENDDNRIWWTDNKWTIINAFEIGNRYESTDDVATPDLVTTWTVGDDGSLPVPTVTIATTYTLTGTDATLTYTQGAQNYTLSLEAGTYSLTGTNAGLTSARTMACNAGSYTLTGTNVDFYRALVMACEAGSYALTGTDVSLVILRNYILACSAGTYSLTGTNAALTSALTMALEAGSYALTGTNADLTVTYSAGGVPKQYLHYARLRSN